MIQPNRRQQKIQIGPKRKIAFVCSGGAAKAGAFHLGVALALQEKGFHFAGGLTPPDSQPRERHPMEITSYVGSSVGAIICTYLAAGYTLEAIFDSFLHKKDRKEVRPHETELPRLTYQKMFRLRPDAAKEQFGQLLFLRKILSNLTEGKWDSLLEFRWLKTAGIFSTQGIEQFLREEVLSANQFEDYLPDLHVIATHLDYSLKTAFNKEQKKPTAEHSECLYQNHASISEACAASTALPFIFAPYSIENRHGEHVYYIDGEIKDTLSTHVAVDNGADLVIASSTHLPYQYRSDIGSLSQLGLPSILVQSIYLLVEQKVNHYIQSKTLCRNALNSVHHYCREQGIPDNQRKAILSILEKELHFRSEVDTIYIRPSRADTRMFFREHFSLSPRKMSEVVRSGFRAASEVLRQYEFSESESAEREDTKGSAS